MVEERVLRLLPHLPEGISEIYFHPAVGRSPHREELAALLSPRVKHCIADSGVRLTSYAELNPGGSAYRDRSADGAGDRRLLSDLG
jgi:hypothetical protein